MKKYIDANLTEMIFGFFNCLDDKYKLNITMTILTITAKKVGKKVTPWRMTSKIWVLTYFSLNISNYELLRLIKLKFKNNLITTYVFKADKSKTYAYFELERRLDLVNPLFFNIVGISYIDGKTELNTNKLFSPEITAVRNKKVCLESILEDVVDKTRSNVLISENIEKPIRFSFLKLNTAKKL